MDSGNSSCSRTRSGLVRKKGIFGLSRASCSRTRSGLVRVKSFVDSSDVSSSRTRSGLLRIKNFVDSRDVSCSRSQSDHVRVSPPIVEAIINDEAVLKESPDVLMREETPVRTQNELVRQSSTDKAVTKDESGKRALPNSEDMPSRTRSGLVRRSPTVKTLSKDQSVIKGLADGSLKEDMALGTRSGLVRGSLAAKIPVKAELATKGQPEAPGIRSDLGGGRLAAKTVSDDKRVIEGLPDGWHKEYRPRKNGSFLDAFYIDPVSGYQFHSLKDVHRYLETGDISQCAVRPKKSTVSEDHITKSQTHEMSYNNYLDADAAWNCVSEFESPTCVVVKHTNPCGVASRQDILEAYRLAVKGDPVSAFGGIVAFNMTIDEDLAREIREFRSPTDGETRMFYEIVVAPGYTEKGLEVLKGKSKTLRILEAKRSGKGMLSLRQVSGGWLAQEPDDLTPEDITFTKMSERAPEDNERSDAKFACLCVKHVKSNAIVIAKNNCMLGMGSGQPNRRESLRIAFKKAGEEAKGAALASDAFFPFAWNDAVEEACESGIAVIAEPGGSIRDQDAVDCCNKYGVALVFTGVRHFRH